MVRQVLVAGPKPTYESTHHLYQDDDDSGDAQVVAKRILAQGSDGESYLMYCASGEEPLAVGDYQQSDPVIDSQGKPDWTKQIQDGQLDHIRLTLGQILAINQEPDTTIDQNDWVFSNASGNAIPESEASAGDIAVGKAEETSAVSAGETGEVLVRVVGQKYEVPVV